MTEFDVIIIGSGQAGAPLSWRLARAGRRVALVEAGPLGGTCVNTGCTPTKTFIASAEAAHRARHARALGVLTGEVRVDMKAVVARKDEIVSVWRAGVERNVEKAGDGLRLLRGRARFTGPREVEVDGQRLRAATVIVNTGAKPLVPPIPGLEDVGYLDHASVMSLEMLPGRLLVLGGGYIGCELGQAMRRFGAEVTIVDEADHLMPREDADVSEALEQALRAEGVELRLGQRATSASTEAGSVRLGLADGTVVEGTHLLVAVGRVPDTAELGCDAAGVELDARGAIVVDELYRTSAEGVLAVGDCTGGPQFTHTAWDDHRIVFDLLHGANRRTRAGRLVPMVAFTDPQVARVGLSEREAREAGVEYELATLPFSRIARAYETDRTPGIVKVLLDPSDERILGATVVGAEAGELMSLYQVLMEARAPAQVLVDAQLAHPTYAEGLQTAVMRLDRYRLS